MVSDKVSERNFDKTDQFFNEDKKFMKELMERGHASTQVNMTAKDQMVKRGMCHIRVCLILIKVKYVSFVIAVLKIEELQ